MRTVGERARRPQPWLAHAEGAIAKERSAPYRPGERKGMAKVKRVRTIDAVVVGLAPRQGAGHRRRADPRALRRRRAARGRPLLRALERRREAAPGAASSPPYESGERGSADPSRWSAGKDLEWVGLRPELVVEIDFDHVSAGRIRHGAKLRRWREDKARGECTYEQLLS